MTHIDILKMGEQTRCRKYSFESALHAPTGNDGEGEGDEGHIVHRAVAPQQHRPMTRSMGTRENTACCYYRTTSHVMITV